MPQLAKLTPPRLGAVYLRTRLFDRLSAARQAHPVVWIGAPAGAGKTTLVASYLQNQAGKPLWYSVDEGDSDPASFFYYFGLAAKQAGVRKALPLLTSEYQQGLTAFARNYSRDLFTRLKKPAVLVLDNYQDAGANTILHTILQHVLEEIPPGVWIIVISRTQPPAEFARLQSQNVIAQLDWDDLQLDESENRGLITTLLGRPQLSAEQMQGLYQHTHGWVTGVVLALKRHMLAGGNNADLLGPDQLDNRDQMFDYFATQVLAPTDVATREFLYAVSFLPTMTVSQCEALTDNPTAKAILQRLEKNYFFTTRRGMINCIYEFHPLFRQFLQAQADDNFSDSRKKTLTIKAASLSLRAGEPEYAVDLLIQTLQWETLADVIKQHAQGLIKQGRYLLLREWIEALPESMRECDTWLSYWHAAALLPDSPFTAYDLFSRVYLEFRERDEALGMYLAWIGAAECLIFRYDEMQPVKYWIEELEQLRIRHPRYPSIEIRTKLTIMTLHIWIIAYPDYPGFAQWLKTAQKMFRLIPIKEIRCFITFSLGWYYSLAGEIDRLNLLVEEIRPVLQSSAISPLARMQVISTVLLQAWQSGDRQAAYQAIDAGLELVEYSGLYFSLHILYAHASMVFLTYGDETRAETMINRFHDMMDPRHKVITANHFWRAGWLAAIRHQFTLAKSHLLECYDVLKLMHIPIIELLATGGLAQVCTELEEFDDARGYLDRTRELARLVNYPQLNLFYCNYLEAYWHDRQGDTTAALVALEKAFSAANTHHWVVFSLWEKRMMTRLCLLALQHNIQTGYVRRLIRIYNYTPPEQAEPIEQWPYPVKIHTLGRFSLLIEDRQQDLSGKAAARPMDLLKCLIALGGRNVSQEKLIQELWPEAEGDAGIKAFHTTLYRLRKLIAHDAAIVLKDGLLSLDSRYVWVDAWTLERALSRLDQACRETGTVPDVERLSQQVLNDYQGPFLAQEKDPAWSLTYREKLQLRVLRSLDRSGEYWQAHARIDRALDHYERMLELDLLHEPAYQQLMRLYLQQGRHAEAAATYERCRRTLSRVLGVLPSAETLEIYTRIARAG